MQKLAKILVRYSCNLKKGEKILIEASGIPSEMITEIVKEVYSVGGMPFVEISDNKVKRELLNGATDEMLKAWADFDAYRMKEMDAYIGIRGGNNSLELSDVPEDRMSAYSRLYSHPVHHELRVGKTKWVILRWPTEGMSQLAKMSTEAFEDLYFKVCNLDYGKMDKAMDALGALMEKTDKVRIVSPDTDLTFSIKGIGFQKCSGERNIPDGEIYTAPVKNSVNGVIHYNAPSIENGIEFKDVRLVFKDGKIIDTNKIAAATEFLREKYEYVLLEGAGGLMVPIDFTLLTIDYIRQQRYPLVLVTSGKLGSINHTLLSMYACKQYGIEVKALVYNLFPEEDKLITENTLEYLSQYLERESPQTALLSLEEVKEGCSPSLDVVSLL